MIRVQSEPFDPGEALSGFTARSSGGAVASFVGTVRSAGGVERLDLQHYPGFTERELERLAAEVEAAFALTGILVVHRYGSLAPGEPIMFAATAAPHRRAALDGLDRLMDLLKTEAPFWKRELRAGAWTWLDPPTPAGLQETA